MNRPPVNTTLGRGRTVTLTEAGAAEYVKRMSPVEPFVEVRPIKAGTVGCVIGLNTGSDGQHVLVKWQGHRGPVAFQSQYLNVTPQ